MSGGPLLGSEEERRGSMGSGDDHTTRGEHFRRVGRVVPLVMVPSPLPEHLPDG